MEHVSPTRMNLLTKKAQIGLAIQGVDMLKKKRDALVREFFSIVTLLLNTREKLAKLAHEVYRYLMITKGIEGEEVIRSAGTASKRKVFLEIEDKNIWGVKVAEVKKIDLRRSLLTRGYSPLGTSSRIDTIAEKFEIILNLIIEIASVEVRLKRLGQEIKKTTRRVNALEQNLIPNLQVQVRYIRNTLEERAREDTFRLKRIKKAKSK